MRNRPHPSVRRVRYNGRRWVVLAERAGWLYIERKGRERWIPAGAVD